MLDRLKYLFPAKELCTKCHEVETRNTVNSIPVCAECEKAADAKVFHDKAVIDEGVRHCALDGKEMLKVKFDDDLCIDKCPVCGAVFLDPEELEEIQERMSSGDSQFLTGFVIGTCL